MILMRRRPGLLAAVLVAVLALVGFGPALAADPTFPALTGRVVDQAELLSPQAEASLTTKLEALEVQTQDQFIIVTLTSLQDYDIADYGYRLGRAWGIGQKDNDGGVILIVAPNERAVRIEVGYGLEPVLTDAFSAQVIQTKILPAFRTGGFEAGITEGADAVIAQLQLDPAEAAARAARIEPEMAELPIGTMVFIAVVFLFILLNVLGRLGRGGRRRRSSGLGPVILWGASEALRHRGGGFGGFSGGAGGGGGGGGFRGGGGSFGGGGASGGW